MKFNKRHIKYLTAAVVPLFILLTTIQILFTPVFFEIEYRMPGFPEDSYGFTFDERMHWAKESMHYLLSNEGIDYLANLSFENDTPIYTERELDHMVDVKMLINFSRYGFFASVLYLLIVLLIFQKSSKINFFWEAISYGGLATIGLIILALLGIFIGFDAFFTAFHKLFFEGDSWLFYFSDTLIRLFPMRLWQDAFISAGIMSFIGGFVCFLVGRKQSTLV